MKAAAQLVTARPPKMLFAKSLLIFRVQVEVAGVDASRLGSAETEVAADINGEIAAGIRRNGFGQAISIDRHRIDGDLGAASRLKNVADRLGQRQEDRLEALVEESR